MNTLIKILLIEYNKYFFILKMKYILIGNTLQIECCYYQITNSSVIEIVRTSIKDNPENEQVLNSVQMHLVANIHLSQDRALEVYYNLLPLLQVNSSSFDIKKLHEVSIDTIVTYLNVIQINLVKSFLEPFCNSYEQIKIDLKLLDDRSPKQVKVLDQNEVELPEANIINQPTAESSQPKPADYLEEILINLSYSKLMNRFIVKYLENNDTFYEEINIDQSNLTIRMTPLIKLSLTGFSILGFNQINELLTSIDHQSAYSKLPSVCKDTLAIISNRTIDSYDKSIYLQVLTFLIFIYSIRSSNIKITSKEYDYPVNLTHHYTYTVNNELKKYIISIKNNNPNIKYIRIEFVTNSSKLIEMDQLNMTVQKYRYLINFDKESFIKNVFNEGFVANKKEVKVNNQILFNNPKILDIRNFIYGENPENFPKLLRYKLLDTKYTTHKVISEPYLHLLHISYGSTAILMSQIKIDPIVSKYSDILLKVIYNSLINENTEMVKYTNSTLTILENYIRPHIKEESGQIELYILYQILIPMIYDIDNSKVEYIDYFF